MKASEVIRAGGKILQGKRTSLSVAITSECPLRCPGCYAYDDAHLRGGRSLRDRRGHELIEGVLELVDRIRPLLLSIVGSDPLVRYHELESIVPQVLNRGIYVQVVTSDFRPLAASWAGLPHLNVVVSMDGLQPEHDGRRAPATDDRIIKNIAGQNITIQCTVTGPMMKGPGHLKEFLQFWTPRAEVRKVWFSLFTPQVGDHLPEMLQPEEREPAIADMMTLRKRFLKLDLSKSLIRQFATPASDPEECVFALATQTLSADLKTRIVPCQFGENPGCSSCGCIASMGLATVAAHKLGGLITVGAIFKASIKIGRGRTNRAAPRSTVESELRVFSQLRTRAGVEMREHTPAASLAELQPLLELMQRVGSDPLLTQATTGNSSAKLDGVLWIKASGKSMADALREEILIPLDLAKVTECLRHGVDPAERYPSASLETAMHATLPHRVVLHVHCVNTIAWAVRDDAPMQLQRRLEGLRWQWIPYVASGLPLSREIEHALFVCPDKNLFVLGNHGLVICGQDAKTVEDLLTEVKARLVIPPRQAHPADYAALLEISSDSPWDLPDDDGVHALGTDPISQAILAGGLLYPCQAIFSDSRTSEPFRPIRYPDPADDWQSRCRNRPFLIIEGRGVVVSRSLVPAELAMLSGLAQVVQRLSASAALRYLTDAEVAAISTQVMDRYRERAMAVRLAAGLT